MNCTATGRYKVFYVSEGLMLEFFKGFSGSQYLVMPTFADLPPGAKLCSCFYSPERLGFGFVVEHETFEEVPLGAAAPMLGDPRITKIVRFIHSRPM